MCTEASIKDNVVVVYELLEEMLDNGFPLATESNILKELIKPPTILRTVVNTITGTVPSHTQPHTHTCSWCNTFTVDHTPSLPFHSLVAHTRAHFSIFCCKPFSSW